MHLAPGVSRNLGGQSSREELCSSVRLLEAESLDLIQVTLEDKQTVVCQFV